MTAEQYNKITSIIIRCAIEVHKELGSGFTESVYEECMKEALRDACVNFKSQVVIPVYFKGKRLKKDFIIDMLVEEEIIVELKAVELISAIHEAQLLNYLKLSGKKLGLLLNFNVLLMKNGIRRMLNGYI